MIITVAGTTLKRVRDWRGRATPPQEEEYYSFGAASSDSKDPCVTKRVSLGRGLLETDQLCSDTWIAATPRTILMRIDTASLGSNDTFPNVRLHTGGSSTDVLNQINDKTEVRIGGNFFNLDEGSLPRSTYLPLVYKPAQPDSHLVVSVSLRDDKEIPAQIHLSVVRPGAGPSLSNLDDRSQVILRNLDDDEVWSLRCLPTTTGDLLCKLPDMRLEQKSDPWLVSIIAPGNIVGSARLDATAEKKMYFSSFSVEEHDVFNCPKQTFCGWNVTVQAENAENATQLIVTLPKHEQLQGVSLNGGKYEFSIDKDTFRKLTDLLPLTGDMPRGGSKSLGTLAGLRSVLLPVWENWNPQDSTMQGKQFGAIESAFMDSIKRTKVEISNKGEDLISFAKTTKTKGAEGSGPLHVVYAGVPVPVRSSSSGSQVVITTVLEPTGDQPHPTAIPATYEATANDLLKNEIDSPKVQIQNASPTLKVL